MGPDTSQVRNDPKSAADTRNKSGARGSDPTNFRGLVLGGIEAKFRYQILVGKLLTRSIRFTLLCTFGIEVEKTMENHLVDPNEKN